MSRSLVKCRNMPLSKPNFPPYALTTRWKRRSISIERPKDGESHVIDAGNQSLIFRFALSCIARLVVFNLLKEMIRCLVRDEHSREDRSRLGFLPNCHEFDMFGAILKQ